MIDGELVIGTGERIDVVQSHDHRSRLGVLRDGTQADNADYRDTWTWSTRRPGTG